MIVLHRLLILFAMAGTVGAILAKFWVPQLRAVASPGGWLRFVSAALLLAIALILDQMLGSLGAQKAAAPMPAGGRATTECEPGPAAD